MGEVYLATDIKAGRKAALKLLPVRFTGDAERLKRFQQEARAVVGLNHPNILTVYEIGEDHSTHYIASELIEGETLRQRLMRGESSLRSGRYCHPSGERAGRRACGRDCPSRHQTGEHHAPAGWIRESARLWDCEACRTGGSAQLDPDE